jgi:hypothetical protein
MAHRKRYLMTIDRFLYELEIHQKDCEQKGCTRKIFRLAADLDGRSGIRAGRYNFFCPITWLASVKFGHRYSLWEVGDAAARLGLSTTTATKLWTVSDGAFDSKTWSWARMKRLRGMLVRACGLDPEKEG